MVAVVQAVQHPSEVNTMKPVESLYKKCYFQGVWKPVSGYIEKREHRELGVLHLWIVHAEMMSSILRLWRFHARLKIVEVCFLCCSHRQVIAALIVDPLTSIQKFLTPCI